MFWKSYAVVGLVGDANIHCYACAVRMYGSQAVNAIFHETGCASADETKVEYVDGEGNPLTPYFVDECQEGCDHCTLCGANLL